MVQAALDEIMARLQRTTVMIAHRFSTIRHAHKIACLERGQVVEEGTHDELLARRGAYYELIRGSGRTPVALA